MTKTIPFLSATLRHLAVLACAGAGAVAFAGDYPISPVPFTAVRITGGFWQSKQEINRTVTVPFDLRQCEESGRMRNFDLAAEVLRERAAGKAGFQLEPATANPFDDSDVYKAIEGAAYVLSMQPDPALQSTLDAWIRRITAAQEPDGYLYTFRTMHPDSPVRKSMGAQRWEKDPTGSHELYDCGHMYEAGVAYFQATGKRTLLDVCLKNAELLWHDFGDGKWRLAPGHEEVELGLVKLYRVTGDSRWLKLAQVFLDARGPGGPPYNQQQKLVIDQDAAVGHAVRANYLYSGMADVAALTGDARYLAAIHKIWDNMASKKLYLTGGVGALAKGEAYGADYQLPANGYNETCAAVGLMLWNHRMFLFTGDGKYMDVFERTAFNGFISGVSSSGDRFFYTNPLVYDGASKNNHGNAGRAPWFGTACCPPNLMRTLASLTGYFYAVRGDSLFVNFYAQSEAETVVDGTKVNLSQTTDYPWTGAVKLAVSPEKPATFTVRVRIPTWARGRPVPTDLYTYETPHENWQVRVDGRDVTGSLEQGYVVVTREWRSGDVVECNFPMDVQRVHGNEKIAATRGQVAFERGPVVYCVEGIDQSLPIAGLGESVRVAARTHPEFPADAVTLRIDAPGAPLTAIPYYAWNNRGLAPMTVWLREAGKQSSGTATTFSGRAPTPFRADMAFGRARTPFRADAAGSGVPALPADPAGRGVPALPDPAGAERRS